MEQSANVSALAEISKSINEDMFYSKVRSVACQKGVIVKSRKDAKEFIRDSLLARETGEAVGKIAQVATNDQRAPIYADIDPITSRAPGGSNHCFAQSNAPARQNNVAQSNASARQNSNVNTYTPVPAMSKEEIFEAIMRKVPADMSPVRENGRIVHSDIWVRLQCRIGHVHAYYLAKVDAMLRGCHTCKNEDKYATEIRIFMEKATGLPFIIGSKNCIKSDEAKIYVYRVTSYQKTQVWTKGGVLNCVVQSKRGCVDALKRKLRACKYQMPDGRYIRNLLGDTVISFDESVSDSVVFEPVRPVRIPSRFEFRESVPYDSAAAFTSFDEAIATTQRNSCVKKTETHAKHTTGSTSAFITDVF